ncbi:protein DETOXIFICATION 33-like [Telopea speciosissima]|uniref:protein DETOXIFICATION 33-like n=1 Tax=Telopea speciosissima TaxID=54955 RepID=UPI001CC33A32|nr:protein DETOXIFICATION 33-like [Telopea speciosissima]
MEEDSILLLQLHEGHKTNNPTVDLIKQVGVESKKLWSIGGPAIFTSICQYTLTAITQTFIGHVGTIQLAAVSMASSVVAGFAFGIMLGMASALETLCGQAFGAGQLTMLGIYLQRSWVISFCTALVLVPLYVFSPPILKLLGENTEIADATGKFAIYILPQLFAYSVNYPIQKFLQAQRKVMVMAWVSGTVMVIHVFVSWLLILKIDLGLVGAAIALDLSWWLIVLGHLIYILVGNTDRAWTGFSFLAFKDLYGFVKLSLASGFGILVLDVADSYNRIFEEPISNS